MDETKKTKRKVKIVIELFPSVDYHFWQRFLCTTFIHLLCVYVQAARHEAKRSKERNVDCLNIKYPRRASSFHWIDSGNVGECKDVDVDRILRNIFLFFFFTFKIYSHSFNASVFLSPCSEYGKKWRDFFSSFKTTDIVHQYVFINRFFSSKDYVILSHSHEFTLSAWNKSIYAARISFFWLEWTLVSLLVHWVETMRFTVDSRALFLRRKNLLNPQFNYAMSRDFTASSKENNNISCSVFLISSINSKFVYQKYMQTSRNDTKGQWIFVCASSQQFSTNFQWTNWDTFESMTKFGS